MKKSLATLLCLSAMAAPIAPAQNTFSTEETFDSIINVLLTPATDENNPIVEWKAVESIKGVHWEQPSNLVPSPYHLTRFGTAGDNFEFEINGSHEIIASAVILISSDKKSIGIDRFNSNELTKRTSSCDEDTQTLKIAFYEWEKPGFSPLLFYYEKEVDPKKPYRELYVIGNGQPIGSSLYDLIYAKGCDIEAND